MKQAFGSDFALFFLLMTTRLGIGLTAESRSWGRFSSSSSSIVSRTSRFISDEAHRHQPPQQPQQQQRRQRRRPRLLPPTVVSNCSHRDAFHHEALKRPSQRGLKMTMKTQVESNSLSSFPAQQRLSPAWRTVTTKAIRGGSSGVRGSSLEGAMETDDNGKRNTTTAARAEAEKTTTGETSNTKDAAAAIDGASATMAAPASAAVSSSAVAPPGGVPMTKYEVSACAVQGGRRYMEDFFFCNSPQNSLAAVFDGHGGPAVSRYLRQNLYAHIQASLPTTAAVGPPPAAAPDADSSSEQEEDDDDDGPLKEESRKEDDETSGASPSSATATTTTSALFPSVEDYDEAIRAALQKVDSEVERVSHWSFQGSTAVVVWIHETPKRRDVNGAPVLQNRTIIAANVGDSRAVLSRNGTAVELTADHKPNDDRERARIEKRGGYVEWCGLCDPQGMPVEGSGVYRLNGNLALSRAIGDRSEKPVVSSEPDIVHVAVEAAADQFVMLATDGLWDVFTSQEAVSFVHSQLQEASGGPKPDYDLKELQEKMCDMLVAEALKRGTLDNVTVVIIWLRSVR